MSKHNKVDILIIGAGAAGLMAAKHLSRASKKVLVLEARNRTGGRIHTWNTDDFKQPVELGAEFVHGQLPVTLNLLKEAGIKSLKAVGDMWRYADGQFEKSEQFLVNYDLIIEKLNALNSDITLNEFLETYFGEEKYAETCDSLRNFAAGYDTADPDRFSVFAMRKELQSEDDEHQYRVNGGYANMIKYLEREVLERGGEIQLSTVVQQIKWQAGKVTAVDINGQEFTATKIIIALPLGVLQAHQSEAGAITFIPSLPIQQQAIKNMGMGSVIKILLQFDHIFWEQQALKKGAHADVKNMSYLFSNEAIPTWWTQTPNAMPLLTGWLGGPAAFELKDCSDDDILRLALNSLSNIYDVTLVDLKSMLAASKVMNWPADAFVRGSYSYATVFTEASRDVLRRPEANTIYFTGEALYDGPEMGTVEAALASGKDVAESIIAG